MGKSLCVDVEFTTPGKSITKSEVQFEIKRLEKVIIATIQDIDRVMKELAGNKSESEILSVHKMILKDPEMLANIRRILNDELVTLERALELNLQSIKKLFSQMGDEYISARILDYQDVTNRMMKKLLKTDTNQESWKKRILVAKEITPSQVLDAYKQQAVGLLSIHGSKKSHTAILARSLMLPYIAEINMDVNEVCSGELILDGYTGDVILLPDAETSKEYRKKLIKQEQNLQELTWLSRIESKTKDGKRIPLYCNIEIPEELTALEKLNIDGIGLFRTEFLYLDRQDLPDEEEQFGIYKRVAEKLSPRPVIIRTIDLGGDKIAESVCEKEANPNLGLRGIRLSFKFLKLFKAQINAILRAAVFGNVKIMFPMVANVSEIIKARKIIKDCITDLEAEGREFKPDIEIGTMIEIPSAAIRSREIAAECDFLSIGTNDLVQYTLAVDRNNDLVAEYYNEMDPGVLYLISEVCRSAHQVGIKVAVCGEMASQEKYTKLLIGLGVDELSTTAANYGEIKKTILKLDTKECKKYSESLIK